MLTSLETPLSNKHGMVHNSIRPKQQYRKIRFPSVLTARSYRKREAISNLTLGRRIRERGTDGKNEHQHLVALVVEGIGLFETFSDWICSIEVVHDLI